MKAILVVDIPDEVWKNKEKDLGMYVELWSERIDKDWVGKYYSDSLKSMPTIKVALFDPNHCDMEEEIKIISEIDGYNRCIDEILGEEK